MVGEIDDGIVAHKADMWVLSPSTIITTSPTFLLFSFFSFPSYYYPTNTIVSPIPSSTLLLSPQFASYICSKNSILMEKTLGLLGTTAGGGGGVPSGGSTTGSMSTVSKEDNSMGLFSSEVSSSYPDESGLELGLGLSLGGVASFKSKPAPWGQYARILTAKDFSTLVSKSSSSSSFAVTKVANKNNSNISSAGSKRIASDSLSPPNGGTTSQVVGWPPIRAHRMNSLVNQAKLPLTEEFSSIVEEQKSENVVAKKFNNSCNKHKNDAKEKGPLKTSLFVKVNMDGFPIGRKVDLNAHSCYETLAQTLEEMFCTSSTTISTGRSSMEEHNVMAEEAVGRSKLLDESSEFVLTYKDKEGDWMLVGDVPWRMFPSSVKRLGIMRSSEANGLAPKSQERSGRQRTRAI